MEPKYDAARITEAVDMVAVARVSRRIDLRAVRLAEIHATLKSDVALQDSLKPSFEHSCVPTKVENGEIEVACSYSFKVRSSNIKVAEANILYHLTYKLFGDDPADESDIEQFAHANGAYHSWPFVRETLNSLTSKMGLPPYNLPVLSFRPKPKPSQETKNQQTVRENL